MRNVWGIFAVSASLLLIHCGKDNGTEIPSAGPRRMWVGNAALSSEMLARLPANKKIDPAKNCFQVVQIDDKTTFLEFSGGNCPGENLSERPKRLEVVRDPNPADGFIPAGSAYLLSGDMPAGVIQPDGKNSKKFVIHDICTVSEYYAAGCVLDVQNGVLLGVHRIRTAPVERMRRERLLARDLETMRLERDAMSRQVTSLQTDLRSKLEELKNRSSLNAEQKRQLIAFVANQEMPLKKLEADLNYKLNTEGGIVPKQGLKKTFADAAIRVRELQPEIATLDEQIRDGKTKLATSQTKLNELGTSLQKRAAEFNDLISYHGELAEGKEKKAVAAKIETLRTELAKDQKTYDAAKNNVETATRGQAGLQEKRTKLEVEYVNAKQVAAQSDKPLKNAMATVAAVTLVKEAYAKAKESLEKDALAPAVKEFEAANVAYYKLLKDLNELYR